MNIFEVIWHFEMAFSLFIINNGTVNIDQIMRPTGFHIPDIFRAKIFLFSSLWAFMAVLTLYNMKETKDEKIFTVKNKAYL